MNMIVNDCYGRKCYCKGIVLWPRHATLGFNCVVGVLCSKDEYDREPELNAVDFSNSDKFALLYGSYSISEANEYFDYLVGLSRSFRKSLS